MNRKYYSALAVSAVALGTVVLTATEASATQQDPQPRPTSQTAPWPDEGSGFPGSGQTTEYNYPNYDQKYQITGPTKAEPAKVTTQSSSDGNGGQFVQSGASALGGAALALSGVWLYRRRQLHTA